MAGPRLGRPPRSFGDGFEFDEGEEPTGIAFGGEKVWVVHRSGGVTVAGADDPLRTYLQVRDPDQPWDPELDSMVAVGGCF